jgi:hypothetical protein
MLWRRGPPVSLPAGRRPLRSPDEAIAPRDTRHHQPAVVPGGRLTSIDASYPRQTRRRADSGLSAKRSEAAESRSADHDSLTPLWMQSAATRAS